MRTKKAVGGAVLMALVASFAYWLGYQHGSSSSRVALNTPGKLRQVGLAFRHNRNDLSAPFIITGSIAAPKRPPQER